MIVERGDEGEGERRVIPLPDVDHGFGRATISTPFWLAKIQVSTYEEAGCGCEYSFAIRYNITATGSIYDMQAYDRDRYGRAFFGI